MRFDDTTVSHLPNDSHHTEYSLAIPIGTSSRLRVSKTKLSLATEFMMESSLVKPFTLLHENDIRMTLLSIPEPMLVSQSISTPLPGNTELRLLARSVEEINRCNELERAELQEMVSPFLLETLL